MSRHYGVNAQRQVPTLSLLFFRKKILKSFCHRGVSLDWEEFQEDSFKLTSEATHFTEEDIQLSPGSVEEVIRSKSKFSEGKF